MAACAARESQLKLNVTTTATPAATYRFQSPPLVMSSTFAPFVTIRPRRAVKKTTSSVVTACCTVVGLGGLKRRRTVLDNRVAVDLFTCI